MSIKTRFAPSPTGYLHSGNYRTAVFAYLFAKNMGGTFLLRIEDTDRERSKKEYEDNIIESLTWLSLPWDEFVRQSERVERHKELLEKLIQEGKAYVSEEESKNEPGKIMKLVRLKNPGKSVTFRDEVRGDITFDTTELGDFAIARAVDDPLFHFAVVVDDGDLEVTHVIRGEDHISNTPRQILIQEALGYARPSYIHLPLVLASDRTKLSKRKGAKALTEYRDAGIMKEAMLNYLAFIGWNPGDEREYLSHDELINAFSFDRIHKAGAIFDETKLHSVNQHWMRTLSDTDFIARGELHADNPDLLMKAVPLLKDRAKTFAEAKEMLTGELSCLFTTPELNLSTLMEKEPEGAAGLTKKALETFEASLGALRDGMSAEEVKTVFLPLADANPKEQGGRGGYLWPLRYALSGKEKSPDPFTLVSIVGIEESMTRLKNALRLL